MTEIAATAAMTPIATPTLPPVDSPWCINGLFEGCGTFDVALFRGSNRAATHSMVCMRSPEFVQLG